MGVRDVFVKPNEIDSQMLIVLYHFYWKGSSSLILSYRMIYLNKNVR